MTPAEAEAFRTYCVLVGFDLFDFDAWLTTLEGEPVHEELTERRALAWDAIRANDEQQALRHLEWMMLRWRWIARADALFPLAQLGAKFTGGREPGTVGAVRKFVRRHLAKHPDAKAQEVWAALSAKPPRGVEVYEANGRVERYVRTAGKADTSYRTFQNLVSAERAKRP